MTEKKRTEQEQQIFNELQLVQTQSVIISQLTNLGISILDEDFSKLEIVYKIARIIQREDFYALNVPEERP